MREERFTFVGKKISKKKVLNVWKTVTDKPFPFGKIKLYLLKNEEFYRVLNILKKSPNLEDQRIWEYGEKGMDQEIEAVVFGGGENDYWVFVKKDGKLTLEENLNHELRHIAKGEVALHIEKEG